MSIGKGTHRLVALDLLGAVAGALARQENASNTLAGVRAVIAADGPEAEVFLVLDEKGSPVYCAGWPEACHESINDAINELGIEGAERWTVRGAMLTPNASFSREPKRSFGESDGSDS